MRHILCNLINPLSPDKAEFLPLHVLSLQDSKISAITPLTEFHGTVTDDYSDKLALPGFIDLHVHLSQYRMRGLYEPALLPWLNNHVFPEEARSAAPDYAQGLAKQFFVALLKAGTTMSVVYTAPFASACETAFVTATDMGIRALIGMTMMDMNSPTSLLQTTANSLQDSIDLFERWHGKSDRLDYIFTPRFAPTCTMELMQEIASYAVRKKAWIQTHLSENKDELAWVQQLFGLSSYTEVYHAAGLLTERSIFAHAIHLSSAELKLLSDTKAKIAHCPDSNFYLKSGEYPLAAIEEAGIEYGLGSDVGAGTTLNMLYHAKIMNFRQNYTPVLPAKALYHITLGSAELLGLDSSIGSLEPGKEADIVFLSPPTGYDIGENSLSQLIFFGHEFAVSETLVAGASQYKA